MYYTFTTFNVISKNIFTYYIKNLEKYVYYNRTNTNTGQLIE